MSRNGFDRSGCSLFVLADASAELNRCFVQLGKQLGRFAAEVPGENLVGIFLGAEATEPGASSEESLHRG